MKRNGALRAVLVATALVVPGCARRPAPTPSPPPLDVAFSGCSAVLAGPVCEIAGTRTLRLRVTAPEASLRVALDDTSRPATGPVVQGGTLLSVEVSDAVRRVSLCAERDASEACFHLAIAPRLNVPALSEARALRASGKAADAEGRLRALLADPDPLIRQQATRDLARVERDLGRGEAVFTRFREAIELDRARGRLSDEVDDRLALAYALVYDARRFEEVRELFPAMAELLPSYPDGAARAPYFAGLGAYESGDLRAALHRFRASAEASERLGLVDQQVDALSLWSDTLAILGRSAEAEERIQQARALLPPTAPACQRARLASNAGWTSARVAGTGATGMVAGSGTTGMVAGSGTTGMVAGTGATGMVAGSTTGMVAGSGTTGMVAGSGTTGMVAGSGTTGMVAGSGTTGMDPRSFLEEAIGLYQRECPDPPRLANALTNLALAEIELGRPDEARRALDRARAEDPRAGPRIQAYWTMIDGRIALFQRRFDEALRLHEALAVIGERALFPELRLEAALGRAQALEGLHRDDAARKAYEEAEALLSDWTRLVPLGEGRETFLGRYDRAAKLRIDFLLRTRPAREAALAARQSRARALRALAWMDRPGELSPERRATWERSLAAYRKARAALDERAASDQWLPVDRQARALAERTAEQATLGAALEQALSELGPAPFPREEGSRSAPLSAPSEGSRSALLSAPSEGSRSALLSAPSEGSRTAPLSAPSEGSRSAPLSAPSEGEVVLVYHPVRDGWAGFAIGADSASARRLGAIDPAASPAVLAASLIEPFRDVLAGAARLRIAAYGALDQVDFHALPWNGRPLAASFPVAYGLDLPPSAPPDAESPAGPLALIVDDPLDDLPASRSEAARVAEALAHQGFRVERIEGEKATHAAVVAGLGAPGLALFHYAGHALFAGRDGWESGLPLAAGGWLTVGDVLALARAPGDVVLSGCDTARTAEAGGAAGLGIGQAFLLAGASVVVASSRPVRDELAQRTMEILCGGSAARLGLAAALGDAQRALSAPGDAASGAMSFRALVR
ncbi:MAG: CHAT domain-containing protein [Polyangiaceae bacterium]